MRDGVLCPAWKEGSAFYFYAFSIAEKPVYAYDMRGNPISKTYTRDKERTIYTIDMDSDDVY
jgi:hypothetical protein